MTGTVKPAPAPMDLSWGTATDEATGQHFVHLQIETYFGAFQFLIDPDTALKVGDGMMQLGRRLKLSGGMKLIVPDVAPQTIEQIRKDVIEKKDKEK